MLKKKILLLTHNLDMPMDGVIIDDDKVVPFSELSSQTGVQDWISLAKNCEILFVVPGADVFLTEVKLPKLTQAQLVKAVPFALEEQLAEDINHLHFAIGEMSPDKKMSVAVASKQKMLEWKQRLDSIYDPEQHSLLTLLPNTLLLPWRSNTWTIFIDDNTALVRTGRNLGFAIDYDKLWLILRLYLQRPVENCPQLISYMGEPPVPDVELEFFKQCHISFEQPPPLKKIDLMVSSLQDLPTFNLLQGAYAYHAYSSKNKFFNRSTLALLGALLGVMTLGEAAQILILKQHVSILNKQIVKNFSRAFPDVHIPDAQIQPYMLKELHALRMTHAKSPLLSILRSVALAISGRPGVKLLGFAYEHKQLNLQLTAKDFVILESLSQALRLQHMQVEQSEVKKSGNNIEARLLIHEKF